MKSAVLLVIDGVGDLPTPKTALQLARKPNLDRLAKNGVTGLLHSVGTGVVPGSDTSHLEILGYPARHHYRGRGALEALGVGMQLQEGDIAFRTNFASIRDGRIIDRRAGRIDTETAGRIAASITNIKIDDVEVLFRHSVEHRGVVVLRGPGLSPNVTDTDPHALVALHECTPRDDTKEAKKTAYLVNKFSAIVNKRLAGLDRIVNSVNHEQRSSWLEENRRREQAGLLPANALLLRGPGQFARIPAIDERFGLKSACIAGGALYKGVATFIGMDIFLVPGATGDKNTNLKAKADAAKRALAEGYTFVFMHIKATDSFGHDGDLKGKAAFIERIDREVVSELMKTDAYLVVTGDHSTPCSRKEHSAHEVPILVYGKDERPDKVEKFDEMSCMEGGLGHIHGHNVMAIILNMIEKAPKFGS